MMPQARRYALPAYIAIAVAGFFFYGAFGAQLHALLSAAGDLAAPTPWAHLIAMGAFVAVFVVTVFFSVPSAPLFYAASGYFFGALEGAAIGALATTVGSIAAFHFFRQALPVGGTSKSIEVRNMFVTLLLLRCSPWFPSPLVNVLCSVFGVRISTFFVTTLLGTFPLISVYTLAASRLRGPLDISTLYSPEIITAFSVLSLLSLVGLLKPLRIVLEHLRALIDTQDHCARASATSAQDHTKNGTLRPPPRRAEKPTAAAH